MTEKRICESAFEKRYRGLTDNEAVVIGRGNQFPSSEIYTSRYEDVLFEYRRYVGDPNAELPQEIIDQLNLKAA